MPNYLLVAAGSALGGMARYYVSGVVQRVSETAFPAGTLAVNVVGCAAVGAFMAWFEARTQLAPEVRVFFVAGVLGGFTTFSAFGYESSALLRGGEGGLALWNVAAHVGLGLGAVAAGRAVVGILGR